MNFADAAVLVRAARDGGYAVPALNTNGATYEITRAALETAEALSAPVILQVYEPNAAYRGLDFFVRQVQALTVDLDISVPVALQLDHGKSPEVVARAVAAGLTTVMFDASHEARAVNVQRTREVVAFAHERGVSVEAEIGCVRGNEAAAAPAAGRTPVPERPPPSSEVTDPAEARAFVRETGVDMLAPAIGSVHGVYRHQDALNFELLTKLAATVPVPLVMHGTCGISATDLSRLAAGGTAKINFGEPFRYRFVELFAELTDTMAHLWHPWRIQREIKNRLCEEMKTLIQALGAAGKAAGGAAAGRSQ